MPRLIALAHCLPSYKEGSSNLLQRLAITSSYEKAESGQALSQESNKLRQAAISQRDCTWDPAEEGERRESLPLGSLMITR
jgi:hypothetical protein